MEFVTRPIWTKTLVTLPATQQARRQTVKKALLPIEANFEGEKKRRAALTTL
jgi:hypothetical protein